MATNLRLLRNAAWRGHPRDAKAAEAEFDAEVAYRAARGDLLSYILYVHGSKHPDIRSFCFAPHALVMAEHVERNAAALITSHPESGKGLALDTVLPTPDGWSTMAELGVGSSLFSVDGAVTRVVFVSEVHNRPCYRVTFSDGNSLVCDDQHQWLTRTRVPQHGISVKTMPGVMLRVLTIEGRPNHGVPVARALDLPPQLLPIDPYLLGVWLGDGATNSGSITNTDDEVWDNITALGYRVGDTIQQGDRATTRTVYGLQGLIRNLGLRGNKRVPTRYLRASAAQRQALLEGLMDSDGYCGKTGRCEFTSVSIGLASDVLELLRSLGHKARIYEHRATLKGVDCGPKYRVLFIPRTPVFRLERKRSRQLGEVPNDRDRWLTITSVEEVESVPTRCIQVAHPSHLFVVGANMVLTHNTLLVRSRMEQWIGMETERSFVDPDVPPPSGLYVMGTLEKQSKPQVHDIRNTLEFSKRYRGLFPRCRPDKKEGWEKDVFFMKRPPGKNRPEATLLATGCEGDIQGGRYGLIVVDDPISQKDAKSPGIVHDRVLWILATLLRRVLEGGYIDFAFTRWDEHDAFNPLARITPTLVLPVYGFWEAHPEYAHLWPVGGAPATLWPAKWTGERVEMERNKYIDAGEAALFPLVWMCAPKAAEGGIFKREWFQWGPNPLAEAIRQEATA